MFGFLGGTGVFRGGWISVRKNRVRFGRGRHQISAFLALCSLPTNSNCSNRFNRICRATTVFCRRDNGFIVRRRTQRRARAFTCRDRRGTTFFCAASRKTNFGRLTECGVRSNCLTRAGLNGCAICSGGTSATIWARSNNCC